MKFINRKPSHPQVPSDKLLPRLTLKFFSMPRLTAVLWIALTLFGIVSYSVLLRREGFPSVEVPVAIVNGTYFVNNPAVVDQKIAKPLSELAASQTNISTVQSQSSDNFFTVSLQYKEGTNAKEATKNLEQLVENAGILPTDVKPTYSVPYFGATGGDIDRIDVALSFYSKNQNTPASELVAQAQKFTDQLNAKQLSYVQSATVKTPTAAVTDPTTGQSKTIQRSFDRFGNRENGKTEFRSSVLITVAATNNVDVIKLDRQVREASEDILKSADFEDYNATVSASFAPTITENISELQKVLIEGLIAILVVGSIVIAIRASLITVISMITVILSTIALLYLLGYTLNVITLFGLILGLSLIVDDTIIMVEAIDAARRKQLDPKEAIRVATRKVSRAMVAATTTAALCFVPLAFVGGVLGSFIRAIPVTIIASLIISLFVALIFIPFFARFLLLGKKQMGNSRAKSVSARIEEKIAGWIVAPMLWARSTHKRLIGVGLAAIVFGFVFIGAGLMLSQKVVFNIFPPSKDTNGIIVSLAFPPGTDIAKAQTIAKDAEQLTAGVLGENFVEASYYATGSPQSARFQIELLPYSTRDVSSPQLASDVKRVLGDELKGAQATVGQVDIGPPTASFNVQIKGDDREASYRLATDMQNYLKGAELKRIDGTTVRFTDVNVASPDQYVRSNGDSVVLVTSSFNGTDTTTLVNLAKTAISERYDARRLADFGLSKDTIKFDLGQESENQDSFKTLAITFPLLLIVIYLLLALEFRSLLQPLLIFMAIPFSIFGLMLGLYLTDNAISFFASLGFFALVGLSIKNTILLTDFANQSRAAGLSAVDSAAAATRERFRPLIATSTTAVASLVPLAITSPFWQGLAVVLIFGLASSTLLVLIVFPYYYLGVEYLRLHVSKKQFGAWFVFTAASCYLLSIVVTPVVGIGLFVLSLIGLIVRTLLVNGSGPRLVAK